MLVGFKKNPEDIKNMKTLVEDSGTENFTEISPIKGIEDKNKQTACNVDGTMVCTKLRRELDEEGIIKFNSKEFLSIGEIATEDEVP